MGNYKTMCGYRMDMKEDVLSVFLGNNRVVPMIYGNEKV